MVKPFTIGDLCFGDAERLKVIAGPCVIESQTLCEEIAGHLMELKQKLGIGFIFKASFDKANRTSLTSFRGPGLEQGLSILQSIKDKFQLPVLSDIHLPEQAEPAKEVLDILQIPAFLCRQTDLLIACAQTGRALNVKKGQFLAPEDVKPLLEKITAQNNEKIILTERGTMFGYHRLVVDMTSLPIMQSFGYPVCFDATHAVQEPGGLGGRSGGHRAFAPPLARAAAAVGVNCFFFEVHPDPNKALSDGPNMIKLEEFSRILVSLKEVYRAAKPYLA